VDTLNHSPSNRKCKILSHVHVVKGDVDGGIAAATAAEPGGLRRAELELRVAAAGTAASSSILRTTTPTNAQLVRTR
jgi:hypothetical protein